MSNAEPAYAEALRRIAAWRKGEDLDLGIEGLAAIPPEISELETLERLSVRGPFFRSLPVSDLTPLQGNRHRHAVRSIEQQLRQR